MYKDELYDIIAVAKKLAKICADRAKDAQIKDEYEQVFENLELAEEDLEKTNGEENWYIWNAIERHGIATESKYYGVDGNLSRSWGLKDIKLQDILDTLYDKTKQ